MIQIGSRIIFCASNTMFYSPILFILDRLGFHHVLMAVGIWPLMMVTIGETWRGQAAITRDVEDGLYSKAAYIITKVDIDIIHCISFVFYHSVSDEYSCFFCRCFTTFLPLVEYS